MAEPLVFEFTIPGAPMGKPRMTQRDSWAKRPCVLRYWAWKDLAKAAVINQLGAMPGNVFRVDWYAFLPIPKSWPKAKQTDHTDMLCKAKPDRDNIDKALLDALWTEDSGIAQGWIEKRYDDGQGPRIRVVVHTLQ